jgi:hypothetical protein
MKKSKPLSTKFFTLFTISCFLLSFLLLLTASCGEERSVHKYRETVTPVGMSRTPSTGQMKTSSPAHPGAGAVHFHWETPKGWTQTPKTSGMRLATFSIKEGDKEAVCTIITLRGEAGGLKANVERWLGQIAGPTAAGGETVNQLLDKQDKFLTNGQFPAVFIDYTPITPNPSDKSILVTIITVQGNSVFIKMTGEKSILEKNKSKFKALCRSFALKSLKPGA